MATMLKMVLPVALCLAYLWLQVDGAPYGQGGDDVNDGAGTDQCPELQYECTRSDCDEHCANLNYRSGRCISKIIQCDTVDVLLKRCTCLGQSSSSEESSEYAGAGEGPSTNVSNSDNSDSSASDTFVAKPSPSKPGASSKAPALNKPTAAPGAASAESAKPTNAPAAYKDLNSSAANVPATTVKTP